MEIQPQESKDREKVADGGRLLDSTREFDSGLGCLV